MRTPWRVTFANLAVGADGLASAELDAATPSRLRLTSSAPLPRERDLFAALVQDGRLAMLRTERATETEVQWIVFGPAVPLDDAWLMLRTPRRKLWLEVPYGLWLDPRHGIATAPQLGPPRTPPGEGRGDVRYGWSTVSASLGQIGPWSARVVFEAAHHGELAIELFTDGDGEVACEPALVLVPERGSALPPRIEPLSGWEREGPGICRARFSVALADPAVRCCFALRATASGETLIRASVPSSLLDPRHPPVSRNGGQPAL